MAQQRKGIQLAMPFSEARLLNQGRFHYKWSAPWLVQPKLNGERCRVLREKGVCLLLSSTEELIRSVPHIQHYCLNHLPEGEYDGELYVHGWTWAEIHSVVSKEVSLHNSYEEMNLHLFDWPSNPAPQLIRAVELNKLFNTYNINPNGPIKLVKTEVIHTLNELYQLYDRYIGEGYEGFIIRDTDAYYERKRSGAMMKFKPKQTDEYKIVGLFEATSEDGTPKGMLGGFHCIDDMGTHFKVGAGKLSHSDRCLMWEHWLMCPQVFENKSLEVEYQTLSDKNKVPLFSRAVRIL